MRYFISTIQSINVDYSKELTQYHKLEQRYGITSYFVIPIHFGDRVALFFSKKTNFIKVTTNQVLEIVELVNNRFLKLHNYHTDIKVFRACLDSTCHLLSQYNYRIYIHYNHKHTLFFV